MNEKISFEQTITILCYRRKLMINKSKRIFIIFSILNIFVTFNESVSALERNRNIIYDDISINYSETLNIRVKDVDIKGEKVYIGEDYEGVAIVTLEVENNDVVDVELSNIDVNPYQNQKATECFVTTQQAEIIGMIGNLPSGAKKNIKIGVALESLKSPIALEFENIDEYQQYKLTKYINLK
jgi:hypothetical protein